MEAAVVCIPISEGQIERLKALYPVLKEEILKIYPDFDEMISVDWIETFEFILNREQNKGAVRILINTLLTYEEARQKSADELGHTEEGANDEQENQRNQPRRGDGKRQPVHRLWETKEKDLQLGRAERSNQ